MLKTRHIIAYVASPLMKAAASAYRVSILRYRTLGAKSNRAIMKLVLKARRSTGKRGISAFFSMPTLRRGTHQQTRASVEKWHGGHVVGSLEGSGTVCEAFAVAGDGKQTNMTQHSIAHQRIS